MYGTCSKLAIKIPEQHHLDCFSVFIVNFKQVSHTHIGVFIVDFQQIMSAG